MTQQNCSTGDYAGKTVPLEFAIACGDADPATLTFLRLGSLTVKSFETSMNMEETQTDTDAGGFMSSLATGATFSVSASGKCEKSNDNHKALVKAYLDNINGEGLRLYVRLTFPDLTFTVFCVMENYSRTGDTPSFVTFDTSFKATASPYNATIAVDTPQV